MENDTADFEKRMLDAPHRRVETLLAAALSHGWVCDVRETCLASCEDPFEMSVFFRRPDQEDPHAFADFQLSRAQNWVFCGAGEWGSSYPYRSLTGTVRALTLSSGEGALKRTLAQLFVSGVRVAREPDLTHSGLPVNLRSIRHTITPVSDPGSEKEE